MDSVGLLPTLTSPEESICIAKASVSQVLLTLRHVFNYSFWME